MADIYESPTPDNQVVDVRITNPNVVVFRRAEEDHATALLEVEVEYEKGQKRKGYIEVAGSARGSHKPVSVDGQEYTANSSFVMHSMLDREGRPKTGISGDGLQSTPVRSYVMGPNGEQYIANNPPTAFHELVNLQDQLSERGDYNKDSIGVINLNAATHFKVSFDGEPGSYTDRTLKSQLEETLKGAFNSTEFAQPIFWKDKPPARTSLTSDEVSENMSKYQQMESSGVVDALRPPQLAERAKTAETRYEQEKKDEQLRDRGERADGLVELAERMGTGKPHDVDIKQLIKDYRKDFDKSARVFTVIAMLDRDRDGIITPEEVVKNAMMFDTNKDGILDRKELEAAASEIGMDSGRGKKFVQFVLDAQESVKRDELAGAVTLMSEKPIKVADRMNDPALIRVFDTNNDGQLSPAEKASALQVLQASTENGNVTPQSLNAFNRLGFDTDQDGTITPEEIRKKMIEANRNPDDPRNQETANFILAVQEKAEEEKKKHLAAEPPSAESKRDELAGAAVVASRKKTPAEEDEERRRAESRVTPAAPSSDDVARTVTRLREKPVSVDGLINSMRNDDPNLIPILDQDGNKKIDAAEMASGQRGLRMIGTENGQVTIKSLNESNHKYLDTDKDGIITPVEIRELMAKNGMNPDDAHNQRTADFILAVQKEANTMKSAGVAPRAVPEIIQANSAVGKAMAVSDKGHDGP